MHLPSLTLFMLVPLYNVFRCNAFSAATFSFIDPFSSLIEIVHYFPICRIHAFWLSTITLYLVCCCRTRNYFSGTLLGSAGRNRTNHHCTCEHLCIEKGASQFFGPSAFFLEYLGPLHHLSVAAPSTITSLSMCIPKVIAIRCHQCCTHARTATPFRLRNSINHHSS